MMPPKKEYEKVPMDDFVVGTIEDYNYEPEHIFKGPKETVGPAVRFKFIINGLKFPKYSKWMTFSYHEKGNLYLKYLSALVVGAKPNMIFDLDQLKGMKVKMLWKENPKNPDYQAIETIRPLEGRVIPIENNELAIKDMKNDAQEEVVPF